MFFRLCSLCSRRSIQLQPSTRHFSLKRSVSVKRSQANSVRTCLPPIGQLHRRSKDSSPDGLGWLFLDSYHISLNQLRPLEFFGLHELPQPSVDQELLSIADSGAMKQDEHRWLISLVELALIPAPSTPVVQFAAQLFEVVGYVEGDRFAFEWIDLPLMLCGKLKQIKTNVCIIDLLRDEMLLVAEEHSMTDFVGLDKARIKLVAGAVAAFDHNNFKRKKKGLPPLTETVIPGIVMAGTYPSFFKIPVTETLSSHIHNGTYPPCETRVTYCYTPIHPNRRHEGMKPLDNRLEILKCCEAFKMFVCDK